jgi:hypothetical protein
MHPVFPEVRLGFKQVMFAKDQPEYLQLPANTDGHLVETKWKLSWRDRLSCLLRGHLYLSFLTFGKPLQPSRLSTVRDPEDIAPDIEMCDDTPLA